MQINGKAIILYDGQCGRCNRWANLVRLHDTDRRFALHALQDSGELLNRHGLGENFLDSVVLIEQEKVMLRSAAMIRILKGIKRYHRAGQLLEKLPAPFSDLIYRLVAGLRSPKKQTTDSCTRKNY